MSEEEKFLETYEYLQGTLNGFLEYSYSKRGDALKKIRQVLEKHSDIKDEIFDFLTFICVLRMSKHNRYTILPLRLFTSENAIKLYKKRSSSQSYLIRKFQFDRRLRDPYKEKVTLSKEYLDRERRRDMGTPKGFLHCTSFEHNFLYDKVACKNCCYNYICGNEEK